MYVAGGTSGVIDDTITFTLNTDPNRPMVSSVSRMSSANQLTRGGSISWTITFSTTVQGVDVTDDSVQFGLSYSPALSEQSGATTVRVTGSGSTYTATADNTGYGCRE